MFNDINVKSPTRPMFFTSNFRINLYRFNQRKQMFALCIDSSPGFKGNSVKRTVFTAQIQLSAYGHDVFRDFVVVGCRRTYRKFAFR